MDDDPMLYQRIAWRINEKMPPVAHGRALLVTSVRPGEGKTFISEMLAVAFSRQHDGRVALVECNLSVSRGKSVDPSTMSWSDLVATGVMDAKQLHPPQSGLFHRIPHGAADAATLFRAEGVARALDLLRAHFAYVVLDGPILGDCGVLSSAVEGSLLVIDAAKTRREVVNGGLRSSPVASVKMLGAVLNKTPQYIPQWLYRRAL